MSLNHPNDGGTLIVPTQHTQEINHTNPSSTDPSSHGKSSTRFRRIGVLGRGSYGLVYLAEDAQGRKVVLKEVNVEVFDKNSDGVAAAAAQGALSPGTTAALREARLLQNVRHPHIIKVYGAFQAVAHTVTIVMEYAPGSDLAVKMTDRKNVFAAAIEAVRSRESNQHVTSTSRIPRIEYPSELLGTPLSLEALQYQRHFSEKRVLAWAISLCCALAYLHDHRILHRDIKAANVLLSAESDIKLADFGVARHLEGTADNAKTQCGTPFYLSPELVRNQPYDYKSDMWAVGVLLYELCALQRPFMADNILSLVRLIIGSEPTPLKQLPIVDRVYSEGLSNLLQRLLSKDPEQRPSVHSALYELRQLDSRAIWPTAGESLQCDPWYNAVREAFVDIPERLKAMASTQSGQDAPSKPSGFSCGLNMDEVAQPEPPLPAADFSTFAKEQTPRNLDNSHAPSTSSMSGNYSTSLAASTTSQNSPPVPEEATPNIGSHHPLVPHRSGVAPVPRSDSDQMTPKRLDQSVVPQCMQNANSSSKDERIVRFAAEINEELETEENPTTIMPAQEQEYVEDIYVDDFEYDDIVDPIAHEASNDLPLDCSLQQEPEVSPTNPACAPRGEQKTTTLDIAQVSASLLPSSSAMVQLPGDSSSTGLHLNGSRMPHAVDVPKTIFAYSVDSSDDEYPQDHRRPSQPENPSQVCDARTSTDVALKEYKRQRTGRLVTSQPSRTSVDETECFGEDFGDVKDTKSPCETAGMSSQHSQLPFPSDGPESTRSGIKTYQKHHPFENDRRGPDASQFNVQPKPDTSKSRVSSANSHGKSLATRTAEADAITTSVLELTVAATSPVGQVSQYSLEDRPIRPSANARKFGPSTSAASSTGAESSGASPLLANRPGTGVTDPSTPGLQDIEGEHDSPTRTLIHRPISSNHAHSTARRPSTTESESARLGHAPNPTQQSLASNYGGTGQVYQPNPSQVNTPSSRSDLVRRKMQAADAKAQQMANSTKEVSAESRRQASSIKQRSEQSAVSALLTMRPYDGSHDYGVNTSGVGFEGASDVFSPRVPPSYYQHTTPRQNSALSARPQGGGAVASTGAQIAYPSAYSTPRPSSSGSSRGAVAGGMSSFGTAVYQADGHPSTSRSHVEPNHQAQYQTYYTQQGSHAQVQTPRRVTHANSSANTQAPSGTSEGVFLDTYIASMGQPNTTILADYAFGASGATNHTHGSGSGYLPQSHIQGYASPPYYSHATAAAAAAVTSANGLETHRPSLSRSSSRSRVQTPKSSQNHQASGSTMAHAGHMILNGVAVSSTYAHPTVASPSHVQPSYGQQQLQLPTQHDSTVGTRPRIRSAGDTREHTTSGASSSQTYQISPLQMALQQQQQDQQQQQQYYYQQQQQQQQQQHHHNHQYSHQPSEQPTSNRQHFWW